MREIDIIKERIKNKQEVPKDNKNGNRFRSFLLKLFIITIIFLSMYFVVDKNPKIKNKIYQKVYNSNFSFASVKKIYNKYIGNVLPFQNAFETKKVFSEKLSYKTLSKYNKGVKLSLSDNYLIPCIKGGIVIFSGVKNNMETIIIQQSDGIDVWYSNLSNKNVNLYDYVEDNQVIGEAKDNTLYMQFQKDGVEIDYKEVIK